jgi:hypothetical protein
VTADHGGRRSTVTSESDHCENWTVPPNRWGDDWRVDDEGYLHAGTSDRMTTGVTTRVEEGER